MNINKPQNIIRNKISKACAVGVAILTQAIAFSKAEAYFSTLDTGEMIAPGSFQAMIEPQLILSRYDGMNLVGRFDQGLDNSTSIRGVLGFGKVDYEAGAFFKYVPFPDTANQPAIGGEAGVMLARVQGDTEFSLRLHPLASKRFLTEIGDLIPYVSLPFGFTTRREETAWPIQAVVGAELRPLNFPNASFFTEVGINIQKAFSYVTFAAAYRFDQLGGGGRTPASAEDDE